MARRFALLALVLLVGCTGAPGAGTGTLVFGRGGDSVKLDPADVTDGESAVVCEQIFDTLVRYRPGTTEVEPSLAESWSVSGDGIVWTFRIRDGVLFHDGTPVDAEAVAFSFRRQMAAPHEPDDPVFVYWQDMFGPFIAAVDALDVRTVRFTLRQTYAPFLSNLAMFSASIVSPTAVRREGTRFGRAPVGSGPFRFKTWRLFEGIVLEANPDYWDGPPSVPRLVVKPVPDNQVRLWLTERGAVDVMDGLSPSDLERVRGNPALRVHEEPGMNVAYLAMNNDRPPFDDARVRRAAAHCIDKAKLAAHIYYGTAVPALTLLPPNMWGRADDLEDRRPDPARARALLAEAGHPDGIDATLYVMDNPRPYMPDPKRLAITLKGMLAEGGIRIRIHESAWSAHLQKTQAGEHDLCLLGWTGDNGDPDNFLYVLLDRENARVGAASNVSFYRSDVTHGILVEAQQALDPARRVERYRRAQEVIHEDCPLVPLVHTTQLAVSRRSIAGFRLHPTGLKQFHPVRIEAGP